MKLSKVEGEQHCYCSPSVDHAERDLRASPHPNAACTVGRDESLFQRRLPERYLCLRV
jgi:hypothetical protein